MNDTLRVANCSGFYGDRLSAAREMVEGGPIDVLTGDYLAELTLMILLKDQRRDPELGFARTFVRQLEDIAATCCERDIKILVNAGGLNPGGLAKACEAVYAAKQLQARVAWIEGDDLLPRLSELISAGESFSHLATGEPLSGLRHEVMSANAYLGGYSSAEALRRGADLVICPRVTDAALVVGPAMWKFDWARDDWNKLAAAVVAGHIIECGAQCTGGNYAFFGQVASMNRPGFPLVEMYDDGSFVVTKHEGTDGEVSVGTVTAQLLYEIAGPRYANPDVVARFDTIRLTREAPDRVRVSGIRGESAPPQTKVCINYMGGYKNSMTLMLPGLEVDAKAEIAEQSFWSCVGGRDQFQETKVTLRNGSLQGDQAFALLTLAARDEDEKKVARGFWNAGIEMALSNYPGFQTVNSSRSASAITVYWPALVSSQVIDERVHLDDECFAITPAPGGTSEPVAVTHPAGVRVADDDTIDVPLGRVAGARSGDKGGDANVGFWTDSAEAYTWLTDFLSAEKLRELYPEAAPLAIDRYLFPNLRAMNFVIRGLLGEGVSASLRPDPQAKMLGEELRARRVPVPKALLSLDQ